MCNESIYEYSAPRGFKPDTPLADYLSAGVRPPEVAWAWGLNYGLN